MTIERIIGLVMMVVGIVLLVFGINATDKFGEQVLDQFTGRYSNETMWYIIGGIALIVAGLGLIVRRMFR